jgi:predicted nucleic acid-binding Zn ribbon protein
MLTWKQCPCCGKSFMTDMTQKKFCSDKCRKRFNARLCRIRDRKLIKYGQYYEK